MNVNNQHTVANNIAILLGEVLIAFADPGTILMFDRDGKTCFANRSKSQLIYFALGNLYSPH